MKTDHITKQDRKLVKTYLRKFDLAPERFPGDDTARHQTQVTERIA
jgi:hypothetical protein